MARIRTVLNNKRLALWLIVAVVIVAAIVGVCLLTNPKADAPIQPADLILPLENEAAIRQASLAHMTYLTANQEQLARVALYLENTQDQFGTRPVLFGLTAMDAVNQVSDQAIRQDIIDLLRQGSVKAILCGLDGAARVQFVLASGDHEYVQGFYHVQTGSPDFFADEMTNQVELNQIRRYDKITENWYAYVSALADIKDADQYRLAAWDHLGPDGQKIITTDWSQARVSLIDARAAGQMIDDKVRAFVVCVQFHHINEGMLGPITLYFDPVTGQFIGSAMLL